MLNRYELVVAKEESERVDTLRYSWHKLQSLAVNTFLLTNCLNEICNGRLLAVVLKTKQCKVRAINQLLLTRSTNLSV